MDKNHNITDEIDFKAVFAATPDLYLLLNPEFKIIGVSDAYLQATMVQRDDIIGKGVFEVFPDNPNDPETQGVKAVTHSFQQVLEKKKPHTMAVQKYDVRRPDGVFEERYWSPINTPVVDTNNNVKYIIHRVEDVTELIHLKKNKEIQSQLMKELKTRAGVMEKEIYQRAQEIQGVNNQLKGMSEELQTANKKLANSNEQLQDFAYVASHDLQEPLRMISNFVQLLQKRYQDKLDKEANEFIAFAVDGAERMKILINDLLMCSRVDSKPKAFQELDMQRPLDLALLNINQTIEQTGAKISYDKLPQVFGDELQLSQLWQNLIENSIKYHQKDIPITIQVGVIEQPKFWKFFVKDNGIGIDPKFHERIFKIFQRLHTFTEYPGTGIGLTVCKKIVEKHGGEIGVESELNQGATFYFSLPKTQEVNNHDNINTNN